jgi:hypothetical protein
MQLLHDEGRLVYTEKSGMPQYKRYLDEMAGVPVSDIWTDISPVNSQAIEATDYATQKPEALLERILEVSSNEGDLIFDCFCGSGRVAAPGAAAKYSTPAAKLIFTPCKSVT